MNRPHKALGFVFVFTLFLVEETTRLGYSAILYDRGSVDSFEKALALNPFDAELNYHSARVSHLLMTRDENKILARYLESIELAPLLSSSWLGLTEIFIENDEKEKAYVTLSRALEIAPFYIARQWEASILAFKLGLQSLAIKTFNTIAKADPSKRDQVFDISWKLIDDGDLILDKVVTNDALPAYLTYLIRAGRLEETFPVWRRIKQAGVVSESTALFYVEFLAATGRISLASSIWAEMFGDRQGISLIWNGGFENEPIGNNLGLDWKILKVDGVTIDFDTRRRHGGIFSLRLRFDGEYNVDLWHVYQIVPVESDADYLLTAHVASSNITTRSGISWEVSCYPKVNMVKASEPVVETTDWRSLELPFHTPSDCNSVIVRLRRYKSDKIDKYISGTAWVDDVELIKIGSNSDA